MNYGDLIDSSYEYSEFLINCESIFNYYNATLFFESYIDVFKICGINMKKCITIFENELNAQKTNTKL